MKILITGASGLLGVNMATPATVAAGVASMYPPGEHQILWGAYHMHPATIPGVETFRLDLTNGPAVLKTLAAIKPNAVLHTAGLTNVDACDQHPVEAKRLHVQASENIALAAKAIGAKLIHISTDHLSDGTKAFVDESGLPNPVNQYAQTKWEAERIVGKVCPDALIIRTNFFGWGTRVKASFSDWILEGLRQGKIRSLFVDVYITPILIHDLKLIIEKLLSSDAAGVFNVVGRERVSKYEFGVRLAKAFGYPAEGLRPVSLQDASLQAPRPNDMSLNSDKVTALLGEKMPTLDEMFGRLRGMEESGWPRIVREEVSATSGGVQA